MQEPAGDVERAVAAFRAGEPVCIHDAADREGETDLVYPAAAVTADDVARLRNDAGGLVCVALAADVADAFDLPYYSEAVDHPAGADHDLGYDERSSFSLTVNHRDTYTGITDNDRALTIAELGRLAAAVDGGTDAGVVGDATVEDGGTQGDVDDPTAAFADTFRTPGHVHLLKAAPRLLAERKGHTELGVALAAAAGREPAVVVCEMLDDATGEALTPGAAREYAARTDTPYVEGSALVEHLG